MPTLPYIDKKEKDPIKIYEHYKKDLEKYDLVLIDTAGRDGLNKELSNLRLINILLFFVL